MRTIKPGRIVQSREEKKERKEQSEGDSGNDRFVWDDYSGFRKGKKKREYEKGAGNRMFPKSPTEKSNDATKEAPVDDRTERYSPRNDYEFIENNLGFSFEDRSLLERALTHRSALGVAERLDYERLEFLGDAVLDLSVAHLLSDRHPEAREGELSKMRAALVNTQALAEVAKTLELGPFIKLGRGEFSSGGAERPSILADVTEAVFGAVYRDQGYEVALKIVEEVFGDSLDKVTPYDPKTELQEELHAAGSEPPSYLLEMVEGPEHAPTFITVVVVDGDIVGRGRGNTKKSAQQNAAAEALGKLVFNAPEITLVEGQEFFIPEAMLLAEVPDDGSDDDGSDDDSSDSSTEEEITASE